MAHPGGTNNNQIGLLSEMLVVAELLKRGFSVGTMLGGHTPYDLICDNGRSLLRLQIKTGLLRGPNHRYSFPTARGKYHVPYRAEDCDYLIGVIATETPPIFYVFPIKEIGATATYVWPGLPAHPLDAFKGAFHLLNEIE